MCQSQCYIQIQMMCSPNVHFPFSMCPLFLLGQTCFSTSQNAPWDSESPQRPCAAAHTCPTPWAPVLGCQFCSALWSCLLVAVWPKKGAAPLQHQPISQRKSSTPVSFSWTAVFGPVQRLSHLCPAGFWHWRSWEQCSTRLPSHCSTPPENLSFTQRATT